MKKIFTFFWKVIEKCIRSILTVLGRITHKECTESQVKGIVQFVKFSIVGVVNMILLLAIQWAFLAGGFYYQIGNAVAFVVTVFVSYLLNGYFVFGEEEGKKLFSLKSLCKVYLSYSVTGLFLTSVLLYIWNDIAGINPNISPMINLLFTVPINFVLNKFWAYKK